MDITVNVVSNRKYWCGDEPVRVAGFVWVNGLLLKEEAFIQHLIPLTERFSLFTSALSTLNGQYSIVIKKGDEIWITCCHTWSYPLFYHWSPSELFVSDDPGEILPLLPEKAIRKENIPYFLNFGVTPYAETLVSGIQQVRPGEVIRFSRLTHEKEHLQNSFRREKVPPKPEKETFERLRQVFGKYSSFLKDKKVLVPLTGGYDSRLIACMMKESGHKNVTCATWGRSGNAEMLTAGKVARTLGFPYLPVPTDDKVTEGFRNDEQFKRYIDWSGHFSSMPYLQDYFAIKFLKETGVIDEETVVLPGHPGDFLRGSHLYRGLPRQNSGEVIDQIIHNFGTSFPLTNAERNSIRETIAAAFISNKRPFHPVEAYERWDFEERQCKFIGNSSRVYSFFGIDYMMPLFDKELIDYFLALPFEQRLGAALYNLTLENLIFKPCGCDFDLKSAGEGMKQETRWKTSMLKMLPFFLKEWYYPVKDDAFYREITRKLMDSDPANRYRKPLKSHYYNCYLAQWYNHLVENTLPQK